MKYRTGIKFFEKDSLPSEILLRPFYRGGAYPPASRCEALRAGGGQVSLGQLTQ